MVSFFRHVMSFLISQAAILVEHQPSIILTVVVLPAAGSPQITQTVGRVN